MRRDLNLATIPKLNLPSDEEDEEKNAVEDDKNAVEEDTFYEYIRPKYLQYDAKMMEDETNLAFLHNIRRWYEPASQPRTQVEWEYIDTVRDAAIKRLQELKCECYNCEVDIKYFM